MIHRIFFILAFSLIPKLGSCIYFQQLDSTFRTAITISDIQECFSKFIPASSSTLKSEKINRNIDFNCKQIIYYIRQECFEFEVFLVLRNDTIILGKLNELDYFSEHKIIKSSLFNLQTKAIDSYTKQYFQFYKTKSSRQNFIKQMTFLETYGFACGRVRSYYPKGASLTKKYVNSKNYKKLSKMLRSINPEIKAYGAKGLIQLEKNGMLIKNEEKIIVDHYKKINFPIYYCYGCLKGKESFISVLDWEWDPD